MKNFLSRLFKRGTTRHKKTVNRQPPTRVCPYCKVGELSAWGLRIIHCSRCGSMYQHLPSSSILKRLNVKPVSDRSEYPEVIVEPTAPYCDCKVQDYVENPIMTHIGPEYCPKHNVIILEGVFMPEDLETIAEASVYLLSHETLHWILCKNFDESVSSGLDEILSIPPVF